MNKEVGRALPETTDCSHGVPRVSDTGGTLVTRNAKISKPGSMRPHPTADLCMAKIEYPGEGIYVEAFNYRKAASCRRS